MHKKKNILVTHAAVWALLVGACTLFPTTSHADLLGLNKLADLGFGTIDFSNSTADGNITMGTNGTVIYGNNTSGPGNGTPGQIEILGDAGTNVTISCSDTAALTIPNNPSLPIASIAFVVGTANTGTLNLATPCTGINNPVHTHTVSAVASENIIVLGGVLAVHGIALTNATYLGSNAGGSQPSFKILVE